MEVRTATKDDLEGLAVLFNGYRIFYKQTSDVDAAKAFLSERIKKEESVIFVALIDGQYAGFTQLYPLFSSVGMKRMWLLNDLYVAKDFRRKGIAQALIEQAQQHARATKASCLLLETTIDNVKAQQLYLKTGWVQSNTLFYYWTV